MRCKADPGGFPERKLAEVPTVAPAQMREIQRVAQEDFGIDILQITENAGRAAARLALAMLDGKGKGQRVVVLAGGGNLGAAGLAAARNMSNWGMLVEPVFGELESDMSFIAQRQVQILRSAGIVEPVDQATSEMTIEEHLQRADLVIDALVGYGHEGPPMGIAAALTNLAMESKRPVLSVDVPTGISAQDGQIHPPVMRAVTTLLLDLPKKGVVEASARPYVGELYLADLGIPLRAYDRFGVNCHGLFSDGPIVHLKR